jgi:hypothetical protein
VGGGEHDLLDAGRPDADAEGPSLQSAHVEEVADDVVETVGLLVDGRVELVAHVGRPFDVAFAAGSRWML